MPNQPSIESLTKQVEQLTLQVSFLMNRVEELSKENVILREKLAKYENSKNSLNSSIPPSQDSNRPKKNQSLRKSSGKKPGGQKGREGKTLEKTAHPDETIELQPKYCRNCGSSLENNQATKEQSRQIIDIPPIKAVFTEYQVFSKVCGCGCQNVAYFPQGVNAPVSYGENIEALIGYFHAPHYVPFARMKEVFNDVFNINISEGGIHCLLNRFSDKVTPVYEIIKQRITESKVVGGDETGVKVNGDKHWFWTWQSPNLTFITHSENRKKETIKAHFPQGFPNSTLVHDGWKPQLNTLAQCYQICLPHLQRHLNYLNQLYRDNEWGKKFLQLLYDSLELKNSMEQKDYIHNIERTKIIIRLDFLLDHPPNKEDKKLYTFYKRMCRERQYLFTYLFIEDVPPDNNASERAIRNVKVKQKISGQFKVVEAAQNFAKIRSVIDTTIKNGLNVLESLILIAQYKFQF